MLADTSDTSTDTDTALGAILDRTIRKTNVMDLVDLYLGAQVDYDSDKVFVFFAREAKEEQLEALKDMVELDNFEAFVDQVSEDDDDVVGWILRQERTAGGDVALAGTGSVGVEVPLSGEIPVVDKSSSEGEPE